MNELANAFTTEIGVEYTNILKRIIVTKDYEISIDMDYSYRDKKTSIYPTITIKTPLVIQQETHSPEDIRPKIKEHIKEVLNLK